eukprot:GILI01002849.1.p1 GENE.GILI01002849.1~~GILI01002849.1.p1  ORF type:complete len:427 (-),score=118.19 GILI01002849.1:779-2059(-)
MFLNTIGCGVQCLKGLILNKTEQWFNGTNRTGYHIDIIVRTSTAEQSNAGAACLMEVMKHGSFWPFNTSLSVVMPPDQNYVSDCLNASKGLPWNFCEPLCYQLYLEGNYTCCDKYPNRCYYWNCNRYKDACWQDFSTYCDGRLASCSQVPECRARLDSDWITQTLTITQTATITISQSLQVEILAAPNADDLIDKMRGSYLWLVILIAVIAALLICFAIAFILYRRRKRENDAAAAFGLAEGEDLLLDRKGLDDVLGSRSSPSVFHKEQDDWGEDVELNSNEEMSDFELEVDNVSAPAAFAVGSAAAGAGSAGLISSSGFSSGISSGGKKSGSSGFSDEADEKENDVEKDSFFGDEEEEADFDAPVAVAPAASQRTNMTKAASSDSFFESSEGDYSQKSGHAHNNNNNNPSKDEDDSFKSNSSDEL